MSAQITNLANSLIKTVSEGTGVNLRFDRESVEWVDGYIERIRPSVEESSIEGLSNSIGAFLGESIIAKYGGEWRQSEEGAWGIFFDEKNAVFPFSKAEKQLVNGREDSILGLYNAIPVVFGKSHDA